MKSVKMFRYIFLIFILFGSIECVLAKIPAECGTYWSNPYDYTNYEHRNNPQKIPLVVRPHFPPMVENLIKGKSGHLTGDLDYTLRAIPNHHRALYAVIRYEKKIEGKKNLHPTEKLIHSVECYLIRATHFKPDDGNVWELYGIYFQRKGNYDEALKKYKVALKIMPKDEQLNYNMALLYIQMEKYPLAVKHARIYYNSKGKLQGLKRKLIKLGAWEE